MGGKAHRRVTDFQVDVLRILTRVTIKAVTCDIENNPNKDDHQDPDDSAIVHTDLTLQSAQ